jgi:PIN domain nuclease of toxin-antitoxin system
LRILVDTHAFFWWLTLDRRLSPRALEALEDQTNEVLVSAVIAWEMATKIRLGKWPGGAAIADDLDKTVHEHDLQALPITMAHARLAGSLPSPHRDPFDRILAAQSELEGAVLATADPAFRDFNVAVLW